MVHVALVRDRRQRVDLLLHLEHVQRGDTQDLGLAALEDRRAVHAGNHVDLCVERTDIGKSTSIDAHAVGEDASTDDLLRDGLVRGRELESRDGLQLAGLDGREQFALDPVLELVVGGLTLDLVGDLVDADKRVVCAVRDEIVGLAAVRQEDRVVRDFFRRCVGQRLLGSDELAQERLGGLEALGHDLLGGGGGPAGDKLDGLLGGFGLDHHDRDVAIGEDASGDDEVEDGLFELGDGRERDPLVGVLAVARDEREANAGDRSGEGQARDLGRRRGGVDREGVVELTRSNGEDRDDDLDLVAQTLNE